MPLLSPMESDNVKGLIAELLPSQDVTTKGTKTLRAREILDKNGLSLEACVKEMKTLLLVSSEEAIKMRILDTTLKIHGALQEEKQTGDVSIQFVFRDDSNLGILIPR